MRKILDQSFPFQAAKSETTYRLVEEDGKRFIEKITTSVTTESELPDDANAALAFKDFIAEKQANRERNKKRISVEDAFILHHVHGFSWQQIADDVGQKSGASIGKRTSDFTNGLAHQYLNGASIYQLAEGLDVSANHLSSILIIALERERNRLLYDYECGSVMHGFRREVDRVSSITEFLKDWDTFEYQIVSPFGEENIPVQAGKKILYTEDFYEIHRESGNISRVTGEALDGITYHNWNSSPLVEALGLVASDPIVAVFDMFGKTSQYYTAKLQKPASSDGFDLSVNG